MEFLICKESVRDMNKKPNIILMFIDDLGIGDVSCYNENSQIHTRCIDRLAAEGIRFTDAHATSALCTPSRYGLLTGRYNWRSCLKKLVYVQSEDNMIEEGRLTLASMLKEQGYQTACIGKWHLGMQWVHTGDGPYDVDYSKPYKMGPNDFGFDYFFGLMASLSQPPYVYLENDHAMDVPDTVSGVQPDMLFNCKYNQTWLPGPAVSGFDVRNVVPDCQKKVLEQIDKFTETEKPFFLYYPTPAVHVPLLPSPEFEGKSGIGPYGDFVLQTDAMVGEIMDKLEEKGIAENTMFIFASDNGCGANVDYPGLIAHGHNPSYIYRGCKGDIWEGGHRIPYIVKYPGVIPEGTVCGQMVSLSDIMATWSECFELPLPDNAGEDSISHYCLWKGENCQVREDIVMSSLNGSLSLREGPWKLELCPGAGGPSDVMNKTDLRTLPKFQLYHMTGDVGERYNLYEKQPEIAERLRLKLIKYIEDGRSTPGEKQENYNNDNFWEEIGWWIRGEEVRIDTRL